MNKPKISVVVPVYNAERFLHKCVDSILSQSFSDLELILVDDGSPDNSGAICDDYARQDSRVKVIHQRNSGVSVARNRGIQEASGDYIGFVDSDDWIDSEMYAVLYQTAKKEHTDIVMCDSMTVYDDGRKVQDTISSLSENSHLCKVDLYPELIEQIKIILKLKKLLTKFLTYNSVPTALSR